MDDKLIAVYSAVKDHCRIIKRTCNTSLAIHNMRFAMSVIDQCVLDCYIKIDTANYLKRKVRAAFIEGGFAPSVYSMAFGKHYSRCYKKIFK